jgi:methylated-DNA-[protein]-cysteine S-methyltransferase
MTSHGQGASSRDGDAPVGPALFDVVSSPIGRLLIACDGEAITAVYMEHDRHGLPVGAGWRHADPASCPVLGDARAQLAAYFAGELTAFDLPLAMRGTPFDQRVWGVLQAIPYGETASYADVARRLGSPGAARAVGSSNARNPVPIIVPCHRVVGADGSLTGFGGGIERKRWLLAHEARVGGTPLFPTPVPHGRA